MRNRLLITGAAGGIGQLLMGRLDRVAKHIRYSDLVRPETMPQNADFVACDLADADATNDLVKDCDAILHLGGISTEQPFDAILPANIIGVHNLYEAARLNGSPRIFFASSNHVVGYYDQSCRLDANAAHRPDGWYGVSKSYGEAVALMYFEKFGIETAMVRIGSCFDAPADHRMLATWLSPNDMISLVEFVFSAPRLGCPVIYGVSDNDASWWDNSQTRYLGWRPKDNSAKFKEQLDATLEKPGPDDARVTLQGGKFTDLPILKGRQTP